MVREPELVQGLEQELAQILQDFVLLVVAVERVLEVAQAWILQPEQALVLERVLQVLAQVLLELEQVVQALERVRLLPH